MVSVRNVLIASCMALSHDLALASMASCRLELGKMHTKYDKLEKASSAMWAAYHIACKDSLTCVDDLRHTQGSIAIHFKELRAGDPYADARKACLALGTEDHPTTLCKVDTKMMLSSNSFPYTIRKEPVCFPYQCSENQVNLVETMPMGCNPNSGSCQVTSQIAFCDERPEGAGTGNCEKHVTLIAGNANYTQAKSALMRESQRHCEGVTDENPGNNAICNYEKASVDIVVAENFRPFEKDLTYRNYLETCYDSNGHTCYLSINVRLSGSIFYDLDVAADYNDIPGCFPNTCSHYDREQVMRSSLGNSIADKVSAAMREGNRGRRRRGLLGVEKAIADLHTKRILKEVENCAMGMETCDTNLVDFHCVDRDGVEVVQAALTDDSVKGSASGSPAATTASTTLATIAATVLGTVFAWTIV